MRRRGVLIIAVIVVLAAAVIGWRRCGGSSTSEGAGGSTDTSDTAGGGGATGRDGKVRGGIAVASISGRVIRADTGAPIAGATVSVAAAELMAMFVRGSAPTLTATSDATGAWKITGARPGAFVVAATAEGFLPNGKTKLALAAGEEKVGVDLGLTAGGTTVRGTVTDVGGGPIPGARITAHAGDPRNMIGGVADFIATAGATGQYAITLPDGQLELVASHDDYTAVTRRIELAGKALQVDFTLTPGAVIRGQVVARDTGKGVPGAIVHVQAAGRRGVGGGGGNAQNTTTFSDDEGNFTLHGLSSGALEIKAIGRGYASVDGTAVAVGIGETVDKVRVVVDRAYSISGHTQRRGKQPATPVPGITLGAFAIIEQSLGVALEPSAHDGAFEIVGLRPGSYTVFAVGEGTVPELGTNVTIVDKDVTGVTVEMDAGVTLSGTVVAGGAGAVPVAGADLEVQMTEEIGLTNMFAAAKTMLVHGESAAEGTFVLTNVPAGSYKLVAVGKDGGRGELAIEVAAADQKGLVVPLEPRASIAGRVVDTSGKPAVGVGVTATLVEAGVGVAAKKKPGGFSMTGRDTGSGGDVETDGEGNFKITGLDPGKFRLHASPEDHSSRIYRIGGKGAAKGDELTKADAEMVVTAGESKTGVALVVEARDGVITGVVMGTDKVALADAWVRARRAADPKNPSARFFGGSAPPVLTGADGRFTIKGLVHGTYDLEVEGPRGATHGEKEGVATGDDTTIELLAFGSLTGVVTLAGAPVTHYTIDCLADDKKGGGDATRAVDSVDGSYSIGHLNPGKYTCEADGDAGSATGKVEVATSPVKLDLALVRWASVSGAVVSVLGGGPIAGVHVFASGGDPLGGNGGIGGARNMGAVIAGNAPVTDASGRFSIDHVATGAGHVSVMPKRGFVPLGGMDFTVAEGGHTDVGAIAVPPPHDGDDGTFGVVANADGDKLVVAEIVEGGPAEAAGLKVGDRVVTMMGLDVGGKIPAPIGAFLLTPGNVGVGMPAVLTVARGDAAGAPPVPITMTSVKW